MLECFTFFNMVENLYGETFLPGNGKLAYTRSVNPNRRPYPTLDGYIGLVPYSDAQWEKFFEIGGMPDVFSDPRFSTYAARTENTGALYALIEQVTATRTTDAWLTLMDRGKHSRHALQHRAGSSHRRPPHRHRLLRRGRTPGSKAEYRTMLHPVLFADTPSASTCPHPVRVRTMRRFWKVWDWGLRH